MINLNQMEAPPIYSPVCMIYSQWSIGDLQDFLSSQLSGPDHFSSMKLVKNKDETGQWVETNRTVVLVDRELFDCLIKKNLHLFSRDPARESYDFRIIPYRVMNNNIPREGFSSDLFIKVPPTLNMSSSDVENVVVDKMNELVAFGVLKQDDYKFVIPKRNRSRETGQVSDSCFLIFSGLSVQTIALIKAVIDGTYWGKSNEVFQCFWKKKVAQKTFFEGRKK